MSQSVRGERGLRVIIGLHHDLIPVLTSDKAAGQASSSFNRRPASSLLSSLRFTVCYWTFLVPCLEAKVH